MKHLRRFNENESFNTSDDDIREFFFDYTDENPNSLKIENGLVYDGQFITDTTYMKDPSIIKSY